MRGVKLIGLMPVWDETAWVGYALENNLKFVDEMVIAEGRLAPFYRKQVGDRTREIVERYKSHPKVSAVTDCLMISPNSGYCRAQTLTAMLRMAKYNAVDNWAILCAGDVFYDKEAMLEIREEIQKLDSFLLRLRSRTFAIDFRHCYGIGAGQPLVFRISEGMRIGSVENPIFKDNTLYRMAKDKVKTILRKHPFFHYTWLQPGTHIKAKLGYSKPMPDSDRVRKLYADCKTWYEDFYLKYDDSTSEEFYADMKKKLGRGSFYFRSGSKLQIYDGAHPPELDDHPFRHIDVRTVKDNCDKRLVSKIDEFSKETKGWECKKS